MPRWTPEPLWRERDAVVIGGGPSLKEFPWAVLDDSMTVGCNAAYVLGPETCKVCVFGDYSSFFLPHRQRLATFRGPVFTNCRRLQNSHIPWLWTLPRVETGLHFDALGWNGCTGWAAINLTLLLGARRVLLLGFDMLPPVRGSENWHKHHTRVCDGRMIARYVKQFGAVLRDWKAKFADRELINVTNKSGLDAYAELPRLSVQEFVRTLWRKP